MQTLHHSPCMQSGRTWITCPPAPACRRRRSSSCAP
uniref:Uncharacterized protein n=1 Tax=Arundo donax TaxID=35708 RepID=A0A0A8YBT0_ARUDO